MSARAEPIGARLSCDYDSVMKGVKNRPTAPMMKLPIPKLPEKLEHLLEEGAVETSDATSDILTAGTKGEAAKQPVNGRGGVVDSVPFTSPCFHSIASLSVSRGHHWPCLSGSGNHLRHDQERHVLRKARPHQRRH